MVTQIFTFGCGQVYANHYVEITAETADRCRELMFEAHGQKWSMQYNQSDFKNDYGYICLARIIEHPSGRRQVVVVKQVIKAEAYN